MGVSLLYNVAIVSIVRQNESAIRVHITPAFGYHSALSRVPCAIPYILTSYLFYVSFVLSSSFMSSFLQPHGL